MIVRIKEINIKYLKFNDNKNDRCYMSLTINNGDDDNII